jgi:histidinol-phosphate phosphatase family protein
MSTASQYKDWTLFLDRDGVLNIKIEDGYVTKPDEFRWIEGVPEIIASLNKLFKYIIIVTNQQGVGKGLMTMNDLDTIHDRLRKDVNSVGGQIHAIFSAPKLSAENHPDRKPGTGMLLRAKKLFPDIDFSKSMMVGDSLSDMIMADRIAMKRIYISHSAETEIPADYTFNSLAHFYQSILRGEVNFL